MMDAHEHAMEKAIALANEGESLLRGEDPELGELFNSFSDTWVKIAHELRVGRSKRQYISVRADVPLAPAPDVNSPSANSQNPVTDPVATGAP